jgi:hypothetical protein
VSVSKSKKPTKVTHEIVIDLDQLNTAKAAFTEAARGIRGTNARLGAGLTAALLSLGIRIVIDVKVPPPLQLSTWGRIANYVVWAALFIVLGIIIYQSAIN